MDRNWTNWGFVMSDRIGGRKVEIRWDGCFSPYDSEHYGQVRFEDGQVMALVKKRTRSTVMLSSGQTLGYGREWVESDGKEYESVFDFIMQHNS